MAKTVEKKEKTMLEFLEERKEMVWYNRYCYSETFAMTTPKPGREEEFANAVRDCEVIEELIALVKKEGSVV